MNGNKRSLLIRLNFGKLLLGIIPLLIFAGISCAQKDAKSWYDESRKLYMNGRYEEALKACEKSIELNPNSFVAWTSKSAVLIKLKRYDEALKAVEKAIDMAPNYSPALYNRACWYALKSEKKAALKNLQEAIKIDSNLKKVAKKDEDFKNFWDDEDFKKVVE